MSTINSESNGMSGGSTISTGGCIATDETFGNFGISGPGLGGEGITTVGAEMTPTNTAQELYTGMNLDESGNASLTDNLTFVTQFGTTDPVVNPGVMEVVLELPDSFIGPESSGGATSSIGLTIGVCENATSDGLAGNNGSLSTFTGTNGSACATYGGTYESVSATFTNTTSSTEEADLFLSLSLPSTIEVLTVDDTITLTGGYSSGTASYPAVLDYFEAPEPSTFALLGSALSGICLARFHRRKA
jgi:hypothetical protein